MKLTLSTFGANEIRGRARELRLMDTVRDALHGVACKLRTDKMSDKDQRTPIKGGEDTDTSSCHYDVYLFDRSYRLRRFKTHSFSEWIEHGVSLKVPS